MEVKPIDCSKCNALCCRVIGKIIPEFDRGDCVCVHLTDDNKCEIYEDRPFICNTVRIYNKYYNYINLILDKTIKTHKKQKGLSFSIFHSFKTLVIFLSNILSLFSL